MRHHSKFLHLNSKLLYLICVCALAASCAKKVETPQVDTTLSLAIFSINDYHGAFVEDKAKGFPGAANIIETLDSLKQVFPYHLTIAGGDNFGGSYFSAATKAALMPAFYELCGINLSVLGNHEFDNGQDFLALKFAESPYQPEGWSIDYIAANVMHENGAQPDFCLPYALKAIPIDAKHEVRVLLKGLLTASTAVQTRAANIAGLKFAANYSEALGKDNLVSDIKILLAHVGSHQNSGTPEWNDPSDSVLSTFTKKDFDGIFSAHTHEDVCGYINADSIPIVQGRSNGYFISVLECVYDTAKNELVEIIPQLVKVNHHLHHGINAKKMNTLMDEVMRNTKTDAGHSLGDHLTYAATDFTHDRKNKHRLTQIGVLLCESYVEAYWAARASQTETTNPSTQNSEIVVGVSHIGSIRTGLSKGDVTVLDIGEIQPFFNDMRAYRFKGKDLKQLIETGLHNDQYGWLQVSHLQIVCNNKKARKVTELHYLAPSGEKIKIDDETPVIVIADEYLATGGDGFSTEHFPEEKLQKNVEMPKSTDCFISYLRSKEILQPDSMQNSRLIYEK